jgi:hypothetical protein
MRTNHRNGKFSREDFNMRKAAALFLVIVAGALSIQSRICYAQDNSSAKPAEVRKPVPAYHLEFALNELEGGKKINTRQYGMDLIAQRQGDPAYIRDWGFQPKAIKIGTRVPVEIESGKVEYIDIGTSIRCRMIEDEAGLSLEAHAEVSNLVPRSNTDSYRPNTPNPILRQLSIEAATAVIPGKLTTLGTVDDPDSQRQFQLEVTVTKLR